MQAGITKIKYNNAGQLDHNAGRFEIGIQHIYIKKIQYTVCKRSQVMSIYFSTINESSNRVDYSKYACELIIN